MVLPNRNINDKVVLSGLILPYWNSAIVGFPESFAVGEKRCATLSCGY